AAISTPKSNQRAGGCQSRRTTRHLRQAPSSCADGASAHGLPRATPRAREGEPQVEPGGVHRVGRIGREPRGDEGETELDGDVLFQVAILSPCPRHPGDVQELEVGLAEERDVEARAEGDDVRGLDEGEAVATEGRDAERGERTGPTEERPALARQGVGPRERAAEVEPEFEAVVRERGHGHVGPRGEAAEGEVARDGGAREFESGTRGEGGERAGPLAGARGDETGDAAFVRR